MVPEAIIVWDRMHVFVTRETVSVSRYTHAASEPILGEYHAVIIVRKEIR